MKLTVTKNPAYVLVQTHGALDDTARDSFREQLHPLVAERGTRLILDLTDSPRINSPGVGNLVALVADANTNGSRVIFCRLPPFVATVLSVTKLNTYFEVVSTLEEAIAKTAPDAASSASR